MIMGRLFGLKTFSLSVRATCIALVLLMSNLASAQYSKLDGIAVIVDSSVILQSEVAERVKSIVQRFEQAGQPLPEGPVIEEQVIERLILETLQIQHARQRGIRVQDAEVNTAFERLAASNKMSPQQFMAAINQNGDNISQVITNIRRELTLNQVQKIAVNQRIFVSESEIDTFLNSAEGKFWLKPSYDLQHILLPLDPNNQDNTNAVRQLADTIYQRLGDGANFSTLAVQFSRAPNALDGGKMGLKKSISLPPEISDELAATPKGQFTKPIESSGALHIFKVLDIKTSDTEEFIEQTHARHILVKPNELRDDEKTREFINDLKNRINNGEAFDELAKQHSDDISNALKGGDLGWSMSGQFVPAFESAMNDTAINGISEPVKTRFGWHIIQVLERKNVDMSTEIMRLQVRNLIRSQRFDEELELWVQEMRNEAFIKKLPKKA